MKTLKIWNGRGWINFKHWYACGYSGSDVINLLKEAGHTLMSRTELNVYASRNCWGNQMNGITPERGVWVERSDGNIERII